LDTNGNIRRLKEGEEPKINEIPIDFEPDPKCKDCWGRGYKRIIIENITEIRPCHCVRKKKKG